MEDEGIIEPVEVRNWATPIVCVPKTDGSLRVCGDYKGTVNLAIQTEHFRIPTLEELRGKVTTWKKFTKIGLSSAYQEMVLDKASQQLCTPTRAYFDYHSEFRQGQLSGNVLSHKF